MCDLGVELWQAQRNVSARTGSFRPWSLRGALLLSQLDFVVVVVGLLALVSTCRLESSKIAQLTMIQDMPTSLRKVGC